MFISKPYSDFTFQWINSLNKLMDFYYPTLKLYPAKYSRESKDGSPVPIWEGGNNKTNYPLGWNRILGQIFYPLQLKFLNNISKGLPNRADNGDYL